MRKAKRIAAELVLLRRKFNESGTKSIYALLTETGYPDLKKQLTVRDIRQALLDHPECVSEWLQYSEDKRVGSGWYFQNKGDGTFSVGWIQQNGGMCSEKTFDDELDACALFIKHEIESIV